MDWKEYAKELLIFQVKVFSLPIEDVSKEKIEEFKNEFNELKKMGKLDWDAEALVENYYDEIGKIVDKLDYFKTVSGGDNNASKMFLVNIHDVRISTIASLTCLESFDSSASINIFSSRTRNGRYLTFLLFDGNTNS